MYVTNLKYSLPCLLLLVITFTISFAYAGDYWDVGDAIISRWKLNEYENNTTAHEMISGYHGG